MCVSLSCNNEAVLWQTVAVVVVCFHGKSSVGLLVIVSSAVSWL